MQLVWMLMLMMMWLLLLLVSSLVAFVADTAAVMMMMMAMMMMRCGHRVAMASAQLCTAATAATLQRHRCRHRCLCGIVSLASMATIGVQLMAASLAAHTLCLLLSTRYDTLSIAHRLVHNHHLQFIQRDSHRRCAVALMLALTLATATGTWQQLVVVVQVVLEATIVVTLHKVHCLEVFIVGTCREQMIIPAAAERDGQR